MFRGLSAVKSWVPSTAPSEGERLAPLPHSCLPRESWQSSLQHSCSWAPCVHHLLTLPKSHTPLPGKLLTRLPSIPFFSQRMELGVSHIFMPPQGLTAHACSLGWGEAEPRTGKVQVPSRDALGSDHWACNRGNKWLEKQINWVWEEAGWQC